MADEIIGSLGVEITGDSSPLEQAIQDATSAASTGAASIASAFSDTSAFSGMETAAGSVADSLSALSDAASGTASGFSDAGSAAGQAGDQLEHADASIQTATVSLTTMSGSAATAQEAISGLEQIALQIQGAIGSLVEAVNGLAQAETEAGAAGEEGGSGLSAFRGSLLELAEGLAVTEGLKDLATEALNAYASIQTATVSLTAMSGSAAVAEETISGLEQMALQIPVALGSLVQATQQMTAFGFSAEQTKQLLTDAANASAASGMSFDMVTSSLERMGLSGMAGARQLATLGLSTQAMAAQMGDFGVAADASAAEVQKAFRNLDVDQRLEVLDSALAKFGGIAQEQAQTVAGEWTILKNQWDITLEAVGADLAPLAIKFMGFASEAASAVQTAVDAFGKLPGPIQDLAGIAIVALGASGPILTGLAAVSLAVIGLQSVPEVFGRLTAAIGLSGEAAATAAPEVETLATVLGTSGASAATAAPEFAALGAAEVEATEAAGSMAIGLGPLGIALVATTVLLTGMYGEFQRNQAEMEAFANTPAATPAQQQQIQQLDAAIKQLGRDVPDFNPATESLAQYITQLQKAAAGATQFGGAAGQAKSELDALNSGGSISIASLSGIAGATSGAQKAFDAASASVDKLSQAVQDANGAVALAKQQLSNATAGTDDYATAQQTLEVAQNKALAAQKAFDTQIEGKSTPTISAHKQAMLDAIATVPTYADSITKATQDITGAVNKEEGQLQLAVGAWVALSTSATASSADVIAAQTKLDEAVKKSGDDYTAEGAAILDAMTRQGVSITSLIKQWEDLKASGEGSATDIAQALNIVQVAAHASGMSMADLVTAIDDVQAETGGPFSAAIVNGKLQIAGMGTQATATAAAIKGAVLTSSQAYLDFGATASQILGLTGKALDAWTAGTVTGMAQVKGAVNNAATAFGNAGGGLTYATSQAGTALAAYAANANAGAAATQATTTSLGVAATTVDQYGKSVTTTQENVVKFNAASQQTAPSLQSADTSLSFASTQLDAYGKELTTTTSYSGQMATAFGVVSAASGVAAADGAELSRVYGALVPSTTAAGDAVQQFGVEATNADGSTSNLTVGIQGLGDQGDATSTSVDTLGTSIQDSGVYADSAQGALIGLAEGYQTAGDAAETAAGQVANFNKMVAASANMGGAGLGNGKYNGQELDSAALGMASNPATSINVWGSAPGIGGWGSGNTPIYATGPDNIPIPGTAGTGSQTPDQIAADEQAKIKQTEQALQQQAQSFQQLNTTLQTLTTTTNSNAAMLSALLASLEQTSTSTNKLSYALTGGSLAPSLDTTTLSVGALDVSLGKFQTTAGSTGNSTNDVVSSLGNLQHGLADLNSGPQSLPATTSSAGNLSTGLGNLEMSIGQTGDSTLRGTQSANDLTNSINTLNVTTGFLSNSSLMANESTTDLNTSLLSLQQQAVAATNQSNIYASQLAALQAAGEGDTAQAAALTKALADENNAHDNLATAANDVYAQIQKLTGAVTALGSAASSASSSVGSGSGSSSSSLTNSGPITVDGVNYASYQDAVNAGAIPLSTANALLGGETSALAAANTPYTPATMGTVPQSGATPPVVNGMDPYTGYYLQAPTGGTQISANQIDTASGVYTSTGPMTPDAANPTGAPEWVRSVATAIDTATSTFKDAQGNVTSGLTQVQAAVMQAQATVQAAGDTSHSDLQHLITISSQGQNYGNANDVIQQGQAAAQFVGQTFGQMYVAMATQAMQGSTNAATSGGPSFNTYIPSIGESYGAWLNQGNTGLPPGYGTQTGGATPQPVTSGQQPININITGMTPANAQQVLGQMTQALRLAGAKIT